MPYARGWHNTSYNKKKRCANSKDATALSWSHFSVVHVNHMLINPLKTKSMIITTRQKQQLSDLSLRLSLDGQNTENVTKHRLLGLIVDIKFRWQAEIEHMQKACQKTATVSSFPTATYHQHRYQKTLLQRSHKTSHRLCVSSVGWLWRSIIN